MRARLVGRVLLFLTCLALPALGHAQEAVIVGTVTDTTGGVLPGVTVTAVHEATGNTFFAVTDEIGAFRIPARVGAFRIIAELSGFATITRTGLELRVGQTAAITLQLAPSGVAETVTVTAEAPLLNVTTSTLASTIDPRQVQELPVEGRNWLALALLAPGSRTQSSDANAVLPDRNGGEQREYQTNIDGQQASSSLGGGRQPLYSQDMIAEFEFVSNRFDATQGRSSGVQVNVVTKSGTNQFAGSVRGNFRDSRFNAEDPIQQRVLAYENQQIASTLGGPILRDKLHFFGFHEYEREPRTSVWNTPFPAFNVERNGIATVKHGGTRLDYQISPAMRLVARGGLTKTWEPFGAGNTNHPAGTNSQRETSTLLQVQLTQVLSNRALNEVRVGHQSYVYYHENLTKWSKHWYADGGPYGPVTTGSPVIRLTGFTIPGNQGFPRHRGQDRYWLRDDFTLSYNARGRHDLRLGGEFLYHNEMSANCTRCRGEIDARGGPISALPLPIEQIFPDPWNADTWNLAALSPVTRRFVLGIHKGRRQPEKQPNYAAWVQDDWRLTDRLTLNLGLRYDLQRDIFAQQGEFPPFMVEGRPQDADNIQPRVGFAYTLNDRTVLRGGAGKYYADVLTPVLLYALEHQSVVTVEVANDGRRDFAANPFNGPKPTWEEANARFCHTPAQAANFAAWRANNYRGSPNCLLQAHQELAPPGEYQAVPHTWQTSLGLQRQVGTGMVVEADYVYRRGRNEKFVQPNFNLTFNPETGGNYAYSDVSRRPHPEWGLLGVTPFTGRSGYHGLQTAFTKRMSNGWQASATYTLSGFWTAFGQPLMGVAGAEPIEVPFRLAPDMGNDWSFDVTDHRHRAVFNGIWQVGRGFQVSGLHFMVLGQRAATGYGSDLRDQGAGFGTGEEITRLRPDGTIVPRNDFTQPARNRTDVRIQQRVPLSGRVSLDLMAEAFNLFNRPNWTIAADESRRDYRQRVDGEYRTMQFGFRLVF